MSEDPSSRLPPGYRIDLVDDPCVKFVLRREDGTDVACFSRSVHPGEIRRAAEEGCAVRAR